MKDAVGGSLLLYLVVIFTSIVILFFAGILAYSKAYKVKNRIIEVIEKHGTYDSSVVAEINNDLNRAGYRSVSSNAQLNSKCGNQNLNSTTYFYCVYEDESSLESGKSYKVVTYVHFDFPVIGDILEFPVRGQTKTLGKTYDY